MEEKIFASLPGFQRGEQTGEFELIEYKPENEEPFMAIRRTAVPHVVYGVGTIGGISPDLAEHLGTELLDWAEWHKGTL